MKFPLSLQNPVSAEISLGDQSFLGTVKKSTPFLEFCDAFGGFLAEDFHHPPVVEVLASPDGITEMNFPVVPGIGVSQRSGHPAFRHHRVGFSQQRFADEAYRNPLGRGFDTGAQPGTSRTDDEHVMFPDFKGIHSDNPQIGDHPHGNQADVNVGEPDPEEADPGPLHMVEVEETHEFPGLVAFFAETGAGVAVDVSSHQMSQRVTSQGETSQENHVEGHDDASDSNSWTVFKRKGNHRVIPKNHAEDERQIKKIAVQVLEQQ